MIRFWDFQCPVHGVYEILMEGPPPDAIYCPEKLTAPFWPERLCGEVAPRVWVHAPLVGGKEKGLYPRFDVQLGVEVQSKAHEKQLLEEKGRVESLKAGREITFEKMGAEEWERSRYQAPSEPEDMFTPEDKAAFRECAQQAYHDVETRAIPLENHPSVEATEAIPLIPETHEE